MSDAKNNTNKDRKPPGYWTDMYKAEYDAEASKLVAVGYNEKNLADHFGIPASALKGWKRSFPTFKHACNEGKRGQLKRLVVSGLEEACGYDYETTKTKVIKDKEGHTLKIETTTVKSHQPGNATLAQFMMCNISNQLKLGDDEAFKSKQKVEVENKNLNLNVTAELVGDQIDRLAGHLLDNHTKKIESKIIDNED